MIKLDEKVKKIEDTFKVESMLRARILKTLNSMKKYICENEFDLSEELETLTERLNALSVIESMRTQDWAGDEDRDDS